jgi:hypothetical protein
MFFILSPKAMKTMMGLCEAVWLSAFVAALMEARVMVVATAW